MTVQPDFGQIVTKIMAGTFVRCSSCRKTNEPEARYCISCGAILTPVYCSSCGTANPQELEQCLECGNPVPVMTGIRWNPIVTVLQPTEAMSNEIQLASGPLTEPAPNIEPTSKDALSRFRKKLKL